ncbi:MAG TPA: pentapeptide repeat-containing protein [Ktedonobacteraceae bacterium]|jgi:uncharacterized protein YjbI with pentapeptide repeats
MNKYVRKLFSMVLQSPQTPQVVRGQPQHSPTSPEEWRQHWQSQGQPWRIEPEIDAKRREELRNHRTISPDVEKGIYPFNGMELNRADVEWLLATHEDEKGPVNWGDEEQRKRRGLDLRGANLRNADLHALPLACLIGGLGDEEMEMEMTALLNGKAGGNAALVCLEGADLRNVHLEGAKLRQANLKNADLLEAHLQAADLSWSHLNGAWLDKTHLEHADLSHAWLLAANLDDARLEGADLSQAHAEGAFCNRVHLENANLFGTYLEKSSLQNAFLNKASLRHAYLSGANLHGAHLEGADLSKAHFNGKSMLDEEEDVWGGELDRVRKWYHGLRWRGMEDNLDLEELGELVEEFPEILPPADLSGAFFDVATQIEGAIFGEPRYGWVNVVDMHWGDAYLMHINWSQVSRLGDERAARQKKQSGKKKDISVLLDDFTKAVRANRQLAIALENQGLNEDARHFARRSCDLQRKLYWKRRNFWKWLGSAILALLAGYGYQMWRILVAYVFVVLLCAGAYYVLGMYYKPPLSLLEAILTSITAFHGRVFSEPFLQPGDPQLWVTAFEAVTGFVIEGVFIAMLTQKFFGK